jgi:hypothetical protein
LFKSLKKYPPEGQLNRFRKNFLQHHLTFTLHNDKMYKARYSPYKTTPKGKKPEIPDIKSHEIFRTIYPLNRCGSKQVIIGADPKLEFAPVIKIGRSGWNGIRLNQETFKVLCDSVEYISSFFDGKNSSSESFQISATETVEFRQQYGKNLLVLSSSVDNGETVCLAKTTWTGLVQLLPAINHCIFTIDMNQKNINDLFVALVKKIKGSTYVPDCMNITSYYLNKPDDFAATARSIKYEDLHYECSNDFDAVKCFYEIQAFCAPEIYSFIPYV